MNDPDRILHLMNDLQASEGWVELMSSVQPYAEAVQNRLLDSDCELTETNYLRGVLHALNSFRDHPFKLIDQANAYMDKNEQRTRDDLMPRRRNVPRGL
jgi:hypothetical protein